MTTRLVCVLPCVILMMSGCSQPAATVTTGGETNGVKTWSMPASGGGVAGLDGGSVFYIGDRFAVWAAEGRGGGGGSTTSGRTGTFGDGYVLLSGNRKAGFTYSLPTGQAGTAKVDGVEYDLAKGRLLLIKPEGDKLVVRQVDVDLSVQKLGTADLASFGRSIPLIRSFFEPVK